MGEMGFTAVPEEVGEESGRKEQQFKEIPLH